MSKPLDELYFNWLYREVALPDANPANSYLEILRMLFTKEFVWLIPNDDNRVQDGKDLRYEFVDQSGLNDADPVWMNLPCSFLEMMIGLSRRLSFETDGEPASWFWNLMQNLGLDRYNDQRRLPARIIDEKLDTVIWRLYQPNGRGGLFPLQDPMRDQRDVELWYQMSAYILEHE